MSDTPKTDAFVPWILHPTAIEFCRQLERENAELEHTIENLRATLWGTEFELEKTRKEIDALRADKKRLDSRTIRIIHRDDLGNPSPCIHAGIDLRAAIDAARREGGAS